RAGAAPPAGALRPPRSRPLSRALPWSRSSRCDPHPASPPTGGEVGPLQGQRGGEALGLRVRRMRVMGNRTPVYRAAAPSVRRPRHARTVTSPTAVLPPPPRSAVEPPPGGPRPATIVAPVNGSPYATRHAVWVRQPKPL